MIRFLLPLLLLALLSGTAARADALRGPPSLQGFVLGSTLDEVRRQGHPDKAPGDDMRFVCTSDALARQAGLDLAPDPELARIGVELCVFVKSAGRGRDGSERWDTVPLRFGRHKLLVAFFFTPPSGDPAASRRLYHMGTPFVPALFDDLAGAMTSHYGAPDVDETVPIRTKEGTRRNARRLIWHGAPYGIVLQEEGDNLGSGALTFLDNETFQAVKRRAKDGPGAPPTGGAIASPQPSAPKTPPWPIAKAPAANAANAAPAPQAPAATGGLPQPLGLRGFELGMTLAEVRKLRHPDPGNDKARLVCGGDPLAKASGLNLDPTGDTAAIGARLCRLYTVDNGKVVADAPMNVGGYDAEVFFTFAPASGAAATSERLFRIMVIANPVHFASLVEAYQTRFGKADIDETLTKDRLRPSRTLIWKNARSNLFLTEFMALAALPAERTVIAYTDAVLLQAIEDAAKKKKKSGADKL